MVDLNLDELYAKQLSPIDVSNALNLQNLILPAGTAKLARDRISDPGEQQPDRARTIEQPADQDGERRDGLHEGRGQVHDGFSVQNKSCAPTDRAAF